MEFILFLVLLYVVVVVIRRAWTRPSRKYKSFELSGSHEDSRKNTTDELIKLNTLLKEGALSQEEFNKQKAKLLG